MQSPSIKEIFISPEAFGGRMASLCGWVRTVRDSGAVLFIELSDGSTVKSLQLVGAEGISCFEELRRLNVGAAIRVEGELVLTPGGRQPVELRLSSANVEGASDPSYPLQKKRHTAEFLRTIGHLRPRTNLLGAAFRVRSEAAFAIHEFFHEKGFLYVHTPIITSSDAEGAGEMFRVTTLDARNPPQTDKGAVDFTRDFFGVPANLTVSGQLEAEAFALAFSKVYTFGPTFRAENSNTARHASEFWMIEPEMAFCGLDEDMRLAEEMTKHIISKVMRRCPHEIEFFSEFVDKGLLERLSHVIGSPFEHMTYTEAVTMLERHKERFLFPVYWGCDLQTEHERFLTEEVVGRPVFLTDYPNGIKAFYMRQNDDGKTVAAMDMLVPGVGELIGGSQREERFDTLRGRMAELGLSEETYSWYLDLRRYGGARHCGFGLGFERMIMYLTGVSNIRDVLPFPRTPGCMS